MNGFITVATTSFSDKKYYVMNTSPLVWTGNISESKVFDSLQNVESELYENIEPLYATISNSDINSVWILEYQNNVEFGRKKFI